MFDSFWLFIIFFILSSPSDLILLIYFTSWCIKLVFFILYYFSPWWWFLANWNVGFLNKEILRMIAAAVFVFNFLVNLGLNKFIFWLVSDSVVGTVVWNLLSILLMVLSIKKRGYPLSTNTRLSRWISLSNEIHEDDTLIALLTRVFMIEKFCRIAKYEKKSYYTCLYRWVWCKQTSLWYFQWWWTVRLRNEKKYTAVHWYI